MKEVWMVEKAEADNVGYESDYFVYETYEQAKEAAIKMFTKRMKECGYDDNVIQEYIDEPSSDHEGNDCYYDEAEDEFYFKVIPARMGE